jgi:hypothetical protein
MTFIRQVLFYEQLSEGKSVAAAAAAAAHFGRIALQRLIPFGCGRDSCAVTSLLFRRKNTLKSVLPLARPIAQASAPAGVSEAVTIAPTITITMPTPPNRHTSRPRSPF